MPPIVRSLTFNVSVLVVVCLLAFGLNEFCGRPVDLSIFRRVSKAQKTPSPTPTVSFPRNYHTTGRLHLPHSGIVEPFEAWYAGDYNRSRIDYYYGKS